MGRCRSPVHPFQPLERPIPSLGCELLTLRRVVLGATELDELLLTRLSQLQAGVFTHGLVQAIASEPLGVHAPAIRVLLWSSVASDPLLQEAVKASAKGFLLRAQPAEELVEAVRRAGAGEMLIPAVRLAAMLANSDRGAQLFDQLTRSPAPHGLRSREQVDRRPDGHRLRNRTEPRSEMCSKLAARSRLEVLAKASELGLIGG
jgi:hypothetical protein